MNTVKSMLVVLVVIFSVFSAPVKSTSTSAMTKTSVVSKPGIGVKAEVKNPVAVIDTIKTIQPLQSFFLQSKRVIKTHKKVVEVTISDTSFVLAAIPEVIKQPKPAEEKILTVSEREALLMRLSVDSLRGYRFSVKSGTKAPLSELFTNLKKSEDSLRATKVNAAIFKLLVVAVSGGEEAANTPSFDSFTKEELKKYFSTIFLRKTWVDSLNGSLAERGGQVSAVESAPLHSFAEHVHDLRKGLDSIDGSFFSYQKKGGEEGKRYLINIGNLKYYKKTGSMVVWITLPK